MKYLYGASVQGIQNFIFQTNKLKEIVGASELVEQICTREFTSFCKDSLNVSISDDNFIIRAAGNIKYVFDTKDDCEKVVRSFPMYIANFAPGITISQAVVPVSENLYSDINKVELKLKAQKSKITSPVETGFMGLERARKTGGVGYKYDLDNVVICESTSKKNNSHQKSELFKNIGGEEVVPEKIALEINEITKTGNNTWIAVVHADGNALGILLQRLGAKLGELPNEKIKEAFATFSRNLDTATKISAQFAFDKVINVTNIKKYPIRPVILGGDDLTIIIRADLALDFTVAFLKKFEEETKKQFAFLKFQYKVEGFEDGITACAGIAYVKATYPFHYAVDLAEKLTAKAKAFSKRDKNLEIPPSSLSFYKVQSSFVENMDEITEKTLIAHTASVSFDYGPYLIKNAEGKPCVDDLLSKLVILKKQAELNQTKGIAKLRQWISELYKDKSRADFMMKRMQQLKGENSLLAKLNISNPLENITEPEIGDAKRDKFQQVKPANKTIIYDLIQLHSLNYYR